MNVAHDHFRDYYFDNLLKEIVAGTNSVDALLESEHFLKTGMRICRSIARDSADAEDLFQSAVLKILKIWSYRAQENRTSFADERKFFAWFFVLAQNLYRDSYRKNRKHRIEVRPIEEYVIADPASDLYSEYLLKEFRSYLQTLPDKENRIIENWLEGQTLRSIGQMEGCSHVSIIFCIKQTLQAYLGQGKSRSLKKKCVKESSLAAAA